MKINEELGEQMSSKELKDLLYTDFSHFCDTIFSHNGKYNYTPVFKNFNTNRFFDEYKKMYPERRWHLQTFLTYRIEKYGYDLQDELPFWEQMVSLLQKELNGYEKGLYHYILSDFRGILEECIKKTK